MKKITNEKMERVFEQVARKNGVTVEEVKKEFEMAIKIGRTSKLPRTQERWNEVDSEKDEPTPEELVCHMVNKLQQGMY